MRTRRRSSLSLSTLLTLSLLLSCAAGQAQNAQVTGVVKNVLTDSPIAGAIVSNIAFGPAAFTDTTDASGRFTLNAEPDSGRNNIVVWHPDYGCAKWKGSIGSGDVALPDSLLCPQAYAATVSDSFSRPDSSNLDFTEDAGHLAWLEGDLRSNAAIASGALYLPRQAESGDGASIGGGFLPADFDMTTTVRGIDGSGFGAICYRQDPTKGTGGKAQYGFGFAVVMPADGTKITSGYYWFGSLQTGKDYVPAAPIDWGGPHTVRIRAQGYHHQVWLDGWEIISYFNEHERRAVGSNPATPLGGYIGFYRVPDTSLSVDGTSVNVLSGDFNGLQNAVAALLTQASRTEDDAQAVEAVSRLEDIYRAYGLYTEGAQSLKGLARTHPGGMVAPRAYIGAGRLLLAALRECGYVVANGVPVVEEWNEKSKIFGKTDYVSAITNWELVRELETETTVRGEKLITIASAQMAQRQYGPALSNLGAVLADPALTSSRSVYETARFLNAVTLYLQGNASAAKTALQQILDDPSDMFDYKPTVARLLAKLNRE